MVWGWCECSRGSVLVCRRGWGSVGCGRGRWRVGSWVGLGEGVGLVADGLLCFVGVVFVGAV